MGPAPTLHADRPGPFPEPAREAVHHLDHRRIVAVRRVVAADDDFDVAAGLGGERGEVVLQGNQPPTLGAHDHAQEGRGGGLGSRHRTPGPDGCQLGPRRQAGRRARTCRRGLRGRSALAPPGGSRAGACPPRAPSASRGSAGRSGGPPKSSALISFQPARENSSSSLPGEKCETWCSSSSPAGVTSQRPESSFAARSKCETLATLTTSGAPVCLRARPARAASSSAGRATRSIRSRAVIGGELATGKNLLKSLRERSLLAEVDDGRRILVWKDPPGRRGRCRHRGSRRRDPRTTLPPRPSRTRGRGALLRGGRAQTGAGRRGRKRFPPRRRAWWACSWTYGLEAPRRPLGPVGIRSDRAHERMLTRNARLRKEPSRKNATLSAPGTGEGRRSSLCRARSASAASRCGSVPCSLYQASLRSKRPGPPYFRLSNRSASAAERCLLRRDEQLARTVDPLVEDDPRRGSVTALVAGQPDAPGIVDVVAMEEERLGIEAAQLGEQARPRRARRRVSTSRSPRSPGRTPSGSRREVGGLRRAPPPAARRGPGPAL